jgi:hypothetical protein
VPGGGIVDVAPLRHRRGLVVAIAVNVLVFAVAGLAVVRTAVLASTTTQESLLWSLAVVGSRSGNSGWMITARVAPEHLVAWTIGAMAIPLAISLRGLWRTWRPAPLRPTALQPPAWTVAVPPVLLGVVLNVPVAFVLVDRYGPADDARLLGAFGLWIALVAFGVVMVTRYVVVPDLRRWWRRTTQRWH